MQFGVQKNAELNDYIMCSYAVNDVRFFCRFRWTE